MNEFKSEIDKIFPNSKGFDTEPDPRIKSSNSGYTKIADGDTVKLRVTLNMYRYYAIKPDGERMPLRNNDVRDLLDNRSIDDIINDQSMSVSERYAFIVWNHTDNEAQVWQVSRKIFETLRSLHRDKDWVGGLEKNDIKVTRSGKGTETTYSISYAPKSEPLTSEQESQLIDVDVERMVAGAEKL